MKLYIRTEANQITATGHVMRCLAMADAALAKGIDTVFIAAEEASLALVHQRGYESICLFHKWDNFDDEIPLMQELIHTNAIEVLLIDSYYVSEKYMKAMAELTQTAYIDYLHAKIWTCHTLLNYSVYADLFAYKQEYPDTQRLLGCQYVPLRHEFEHLRPFEVKEQVRKVLVVTGGTDEFHFMKEFCKKIAADNKWQAIHFFMVCGRFNCDQEQLQAMASQNRNIEICEALPTLKDAMEDSDLLITAGGTTLYEMAAIGIPGICFGIADNQKYNIAGFEERQLVLNAGDIRTDFFFENLMQKLEELIFDAARRRTMSGQLRRLVDGQGASRIIEAICKIEGNE